MAKCSIEFICKYTFIYKIVLIFHSVMRVLNDNTVLVRIYTGKINKFNITVKDIRDGCKK